MKKNVSKVIKGFSLIELLVVMSIIALLATISLIAVQGVRESTRNSRRKSDLETIRKSLEFFRADCNYYPASITFGSSLVGDGSSTSCPSSNIYSSKLPQDTLDPTRIYKYIRSPSSGFNYVLCAALEDEGDSATAASAGCGNCGSVACNYFVKPQ